MASGAGRGQFFFHYPVKGNFTACAAARPGQLATAVAPAPLHTALVAARARRARARTRDATPRDRAAARRTTAARAARGRARVATARLRRRRGTPRALGRRTRHTRGPARLRSHHGRVEVAVHHDASHVAVVRLPQAVDQARPKWPDPLRQQRRGGHRIPDPPQFRQKGDPPPQPKKGSLAEAKNPHVAGAGSCQSQHPQHSTTRTELYGIRNRKRSR